MVAGFQRGRGLALGLATAGTSITGMIVPPILAVVIEAYGWRAGLAALSTITVLVGLPIALALIGRAREGHAGARDDVPDAAHVDAPDMTLKQAGKDGKKMFLVKEGVSLQQVVDGLNALGIGPRDLITILQAIKAAGAIQADIEVM